MLTVNGHRLNPTIFPDKTSQVWKLPEWLFQHSSYWIDWRWDNESEVLQLIQLIHLITIRTGVEDIVLYVPYLPYARQDKEMKNDQTFALHSFGRILNALALKKVITVDVHNEFVAHECIRNLHNIHPVLFHSWYLRENNLKYDCIVFPDMGAFRRYPHLQERPHVVFRKYRDLSTGIVGGHELHGSDADAKSAKSFLVVDDICDGGATFLSVAEAIKPLCPNLVQLDLMVTHGLFSKGYEELVKHYTNFYSTNSLANNLGGFEV